MARTSKAVKKSVTKKPKKCEVCEGTGLADKDNLCVICEGSGKA